MARFAWHVEAESSKSLKRSGRFALSGVDAAYGYAFSRL